MKNLWLQSALVVSFAFNVATVIMYFQFQPPARPHTPEEFISRVSQHMSKEDTQALKSAFAQFGPALHEKRMATDKSMDNVRAALATEPFQPDQFSTAMDAARQAHDEAEQVFQQAMVAAAAKLSHAGRVEMIPPARPSKDQTPHQE